MKTLATANHKGGVGKTATAQALGAALSARRRRVLLVDLDPQGSLTGARGLADYNNEGMAEVMGVPARDHTTMRSRIKSVADGLDLAPASLALAGAELALVERIGRESVLKKAIATIRPPYELVIIDCL